MNKIIIFISLIFLNLTSEALAGKIYTLPGGIINDGTTQFQIGNQKYPGNWLNLASDAELTSLGITYQTIADPTDYSGILLLGDSITAYGDNAPNSWASILNYSPIINAGVPSDTTTGMLSRLTTLLNTYKPKAIFVLGGVNDLSLGIAQATTVSNIQQIIALSVSKGAVVFIQAILPVSASYSGSPNVTNTTINARNAAIYNDVKITAGGQWINYTRRYG